MEPVPASGITSNSEASLTVVDLSPDILEIVDDCSAECIGSDVETADEDITEGVDTDDDPDYCPGVNTNTVSKVEDTIAKSAAKTKHPVVLHVQEIIHKDLENGTGTYFILHGKSVYVQCRL